eukprot:TRINITY_DN727_c0_g1_i4.p1 TRINITY_DN727_c0_g1~~TRINITY_DN727_c0_g1_i4.p1  ORF type:complete len:299 (-),score=111.49 TRINITY_DN727_c0_g1_i4:126-1022(-)
MVRFYTDDAPKVFQRSWWETISSLDGINGAEYSNEELKKLLENIFGDRTLATLDKGVFVPSFDLIDEDDDRVHADMWHPRFFSNLPGGKEDNDLDTKIVDVILRSSAAPTIFPIYQSYVDGGVVCNDPSFAVTMEVSKCFTKQALDNKDEFNENGLMYSSSSSSSSSSSDNNDEDDKPEIIVMSFGTGRISHDMRHQIENGNIDLGERQWLIPLLSIMCESQSMMAGSFCQMMLGTKRFHRVNPTLKESIGLDDVGKLNDILDIGRSFNLEETFQWIEKNAPLKDPTDKKNLDTHLLS